MKAIPQCLVLLLLAAMLSNCGAPQPPRCVSVPMASRQPAATLLASTFEQWKILGNPSRSSEWVSAKENYNRSVAMLFDQLRCGSGDWNSKAITLGTRIAQPDARELDLEKLDALFPASQVDVRILKSHQTTSGVGLPLVGWKGTTPLGEPRPKYHLPNGFPYIITATLNFNSSDVPVWHFTKRWLHNEIQIKNTSHTLAADWSAPNAFLWKMCSLDDLKIQNVLRPERFTDETGIYFLQPYDPNKIPIVFVHGLVSSPDAFKNIINEIAPDPWFRERYQIWLYSYPTGNPWIYSSVKFREIMRETCTYARSHGDDKNLNRMVIVSHSMGGVITRSSLTDPKNHLYDAHFKEPIDQLNVSETTRQLIREATLYQPLTEPKRVVFMAVPHRGSPVANRWFANIISKVIRLPKTITVDLLDKTLSTMTDLVQGGDKSRPLPTSIGSLSPNGRSNIALNQLALPTNIKHHSVIGDRGKGNTPDSSDGVVPYWSSHVTPVASELIVPSNHGVPNDSKAAAELERILQLHLDEETPATEKLRR